MWRADFINLLKNELKEIQNKNPRYSLRAYSQKLDISYGALSEILNKKRVLTPNLAYKILAKLNLDKVKKNEWQETLDREISGKLTLLPQEARAVVENWHYFALINLLELETPPKNIKEMALRLGLSDQKIKKSIDYLIGCGFLARINGELKVQANSWTTSDNIPSESVRRAHSRGLKLAQKALKEIPMELRDITSLAFPGNSAQFAKAKVEIRKLLTKVSKILSQGKMDTVYKFNAQLFPVDKWNLLKPRGKE